MDLAFLLQLVDVNSLLQKHPAIMKVLIVIGILRVFMKPLFALLIKYIDIQPSLEKNEKVIRLLRSPIWRSIAFGIDYLFSVKLPFAPGSIGFKVQEAVQKEKGQDPIEPPKTPAAGL